jgi:hypothetical protein
MPPAIAIGRTISAWRRAALLSIPELRLSAESDEELTCVRSQANGRFADIHPETCRSGLSNEADIPLDFGRTASIGVVIESCALSEGVQPCPA